MVALFLVVCLPLLFLLTFHEQVRRWNKNVTHFGYIWTNVFFWHIFVCNIFFIRREITGVNCKCEKKRNEVSLYYLNIQTIELWKLNLSILSSHLAFLQLFLQLSYPRFRPRFHFQEFGLWSAGFICSLVHPSCKKRGERQFDEMDEADEADVTVMLCPRLLSQFLCWEAFKSSR